MNYVAIYLLSTLSCISISICSKQLFAQTDYRNFEVYDSEFFTMLYPPTWSIWSYTGVSVSPGNTGVSIGKGPPVNNTANSDSATPVIMVTVMPIQQGTGFDLNKFIDERYSPINQKEGGMYSVVDTTTSVSGLPARKVTYNYEMNIDGTMFSAHGIAVYAMNNYHFYYVIFQGPLSSY